jgi:kynurenine formamidase
LPNQFLRMRLTIHPSHEDLACQSLRLKRLNSAVGHAVIAANYGGDVIVRPCQGVLNPRSRQLARPCLSVLLGDNLDVALIDEGLENIVISFRGVHRDACSFVAEAQNVVPLRARFRRRAGDLFSYVDRVATNIDIAIGFIDEEVVIDDRYTRRLRAVNKGGGSYEITLTDLEQELARTGAEVRKGDIALVRTGKIQDFGDEAAFQAAEPGVGREAALWLYRAGMAVLGTDTTGTEPLPFVDPRSATHDAMLQESGVHLIENLYLEEVAARGVTEGLFVALPLKITRATGSWVRPILVV